MQARTACKERTDIADASGVGASGTADSLDGFIPGTNVSKKLTRYLFRDIITTVA